MPEGDTLHHYAQRLRPLLVGATVNAVDARHPQRVAGLRGSQVEAVESIGKHLLITFSDDTILRVHLGMKGTIHRYAPGERWKRPRDDMGWVLSVDAHDIVGFFPKELERFHRRDRGRNRALARLGPDLLQDPLDIDVVVDRYRRLVAPDEAIGMGLLDQRPACGIGNIYRCETLFIERLNPFAPSAQLSDETIGSLYKTASALLRRNVETPSVHPRTTTNEGRFAYVYEMHKSPCLVCNGRIAIDDQSDRQREYVRLTWWCPTCQPAGPEPRDDELKPDARERP